MIEIEKNSTKMASTLFDIEIENENTQEIKFEQDEIEKLPIELFQKLEVELLDSLLHKENNNVDISDDETDGPVDFIKQIVDNVRREFDELVEDGDRKTFLHLLTKILATVLSVKADNLEKIISLVKLTISKAIKTWSE